MDKQTNQPAKPARPLSLGALTLCAFMATPVFAADRLIAQYERWKVYEGDDIAGGRVCYAQSQPVDFAPKEPGQGDVSVQISNWPKAAVLEQPSFTGVRDLHRIAKPRFQTGNVSLLGFADGKDVFLGQASQESQLVAAMRKGDELRVVAVDADGQPIAYYFSLSGVSAALRQARASCGFPALVEPRAAPVKKRAPARKKRRR